MTSPETPETTEAAAARTTDERTVVAGLPNGSGEPAPAGSGAQDTTVAIPATAKPAEVTPSPTAPTTATEGPEVTSAAPPPWQRVAADNQYVADHPTVVTAKPTPEGEGTPGRFAEWGYQRSPRSDAYTSAEPEGSAGSLGDFPVVTGTAAGSVFASAHGLSGVTADARPTGEPGSRTTVNLGAQPETPRPIPTPTPSALRRPGRGPRRASLQVKRVDPWSVLKLAFVLSVALFFVWLVAVGVLYGVLQGMGVWDRVNGTYTEFASGSGGSNSGPLITAGRVFGIAAIIGAINIVLFTALATIGSFVYNVSADLAGGLEITLAERE